MTRHPFRWSSLAFGLMFLAGVGQWAVWKQDWLTPRELSLASSAVLIGLGLLGVAATFRKPQQLTTASSDIEDNPERSDHEEADPKS